ncbi:MAG TPA: histidine kinase dimerization/phospho-acceptor domain-containing protein [Terriglobales bacterium]|nr:histidine kinase dimerization/phospho-acceptor domain-containing protein [Terriglobales bacterium]
MSAFGGGGGAGGGAAPAAAGAAAPAAGGTTELIAAALHRMSQPLSVLLGTLELALRGEKSAAEYRASLEAALRETDRLRALAEALRELAAPPPVPAPTPAEARDALAAVLEDLAPQAAGRGVRLEAAPELAAPPAAAAAAHLAPLCAALAALANAALARAQNALTLRLSAGGGAATVEIEDDGAALTAAEWRRRFDPFAANADIRHALALALARAGLEAGGAWFTAGGGESGNLLRIVFPSASE